MSKQMNNLIYANETLEDEKYNNIDITAELDYIYETEESARVAREKEHKIALKQVALKHALMCALMLQ